jgi:transcription elongation factor GreA
VVESDGETMEYRLVSSAEADPASGRISTGSPVGAALMGHGPGSEVQLTTPGGTAVRYRIIEVR